MIQRRFVSETPTLTFFAAMALGLMGCGSDDGGTTPPADSGTDTGIVDSAFADTEPSDTGIGDTQVSDTGAADTLTADTGPADTGPADTGAADASGATGCTSGTFYTAGVSPTMEPGKACNGCHAASTTKFVLAGTAYPGLHEPDRCNGSSSGSVEITSTGGAITTLPINAAGNFFLKVSDGTVTFPATVKVMVGGATRAMATPITSSMGDCNSCHTQAGTGAPGRIQVP